MLSNKTATKKLWIFCLELAKGFEHAQGSLSVKILDFSMWSEWRYVSLIQVTAWFFSVSFALDFTRTKKGE